jgi:hypothetical protein
MTTSITPPSAPSARLRSLSLPILLQLDAAVSGVNGAAYLLGASLLDDVVGIEVGSLRAIGAFLVLYAAVVVAIGTRRPVSRPAAMVVVGANVLWAADSLAVALTDAGTPTATGTVWIVVQALVVAGLAGLQWEALRRTSPPS